MQECKAAAESVRLEADISIQEDQHFVLGVLGQLTARMLLTAPARRERATVHQPHPWVLLPQAGHNRGGVVLAVVIENHQFEGDVFAGENGSAGAFN